jgi:hypothetical protein
MGDEVDDANDDVASIARSDMMFEVEYLKRLSIVHKAAMLFYLRDRNRFD